MLTEFVSNSEICSVYTQEVLNSLDPSGFPLHTLELKNGAPLMLLRNLDPIHGLYNGTRLKLIRSTRRVLECCVLGNNDIVLIPRITMTVNEEEYPIPLQCLQFPVCLAYAMTVNKAQGQTVQHVGLDLCTPVFSHGQLYVALSRCTHPRNLKVLFCEGEGGTKTTNIVWTEVFRGLEI